MANTKFGLGQLGNETPKWAKWVFRTTFLLTTAATAWIAATNLVPDTSKYEITLLLKIVIDPVVYGISKMFGIDRDSNQ